MNAIESTLVVLATLVLFVVVPAILCLRGWFIRAGLAMLVIELLPMTWQIKRVPDSEAPGTAFPAMGLSPFSFAILIVGIAALIFRSAGKILLWVRGSFAPFSVARRRLQNSRKRLAGGERGLEAMRQLANLARPRRFSRGAKIGGFPSERITHH